MDQELEFGGRSGAICIMIFSHILLYAIHYVLCPYEITKLYIDKEIFRNYFFFIVVQFLFAKYVPGYVITGMRVNKFTMELAKPGDELTVRLRYMCNGYISYYCTLFLLLVMHLIGVFNISTIVDNLVAYMTCAIIFSNALSIFYYYHGLNTGPTRVTDDTIYDFFMGTCLYPRIGIVDVKMVAEVRWSWLSLFIITLSCATKQYNDIGFITNGMKIMLYAHFLYSNATVKGEHYIVTTFDMFYEKFGWMLCFWNVAGVPFLYCISSVYLYHTKCNISDELYYFTLFLLTLSYYVWDTANFQKADFKSPNVNRTTFPILPFSFVKNQKHIDTPHGRILVDGWYKYARKIHYTADIFMALCWGLSCGFGSLVPYFYLVFFTGMILHRYTRDDARCEKKYGAYWKQYKQLVPYIFIPYVI